MAEKKFAQMTTKKLNALLESASEEDKVEIQAVLEARGALSAGAQEPKSATTDELSDEEKAAIAEAEGKAPEAEQKEAKKAGRKSNKPQLTDEEREEVANKLRAGVLHHRCQIVPFNSVEWVDGTVTGIIEDKRRNTVVIAVTMDDGRRAVKGYDSELIKILDEVVEVSKARRGGGRVAAEKTEWTEEQILADKDKYAVNIGKFVVYPKVGKLGEAAEDGATEAGRIVSLVPNKRTGKMLYRIKVDGAEGIFSHKVVDTEGLQINEELDEEGQNIQAKFIARAHGELSSGSAVRKTPAEQLAYWTEQLAKAEERVAKAKEKIAELTAAGVELPAQNEAEAPAETTNNDDDMM